MENIILFPFADYWLFYVGFTAFVLMMLALDLGVFHRDAHEVTFKESLTWSIVWISLALIFNFLFFKYAGWKFENDARLLAIPGFDGAAAAKQVGLEFLTGFIVEKTLAVDNIFVFVVVFSFFCNTPEISTQGFVLWNYRCFNLPYNFYCNGFHSASVSMDRNFLWRVSYSNRF